MTEAERLENLIGAKYREIDAMHAERKRLKEKMAQLSDDIDALKPFYHKALDVDRKAKLLAKLAASNE